LKFCGARLMMLGFDRFRDKFILATGSLEAITGKFRKKIIVAVKLYIYIYVA
jgi:hypothetical protein